MTKLMIGLLMASALLVGCDKGGEAGKDGKSGDGKAASGDTIGVAECDDYFKKLEDCISKNPALKASMGGDAMKQQKDGWKQMASNPATKDSLKTSCKTAADALAASCK
jgi:hypothetical protein